MTSTGPEAAKKSVDDLLREDVPNWESIGFEVHCSRCGYNLRTLTKPRCPECGFEFEWRVLIDSYHHRNLQLFEHGWRKKPVRSYLSALWRPLLRPRAFWQRISLHDRIELAPLWVVFCLSILVFIVTLHGAFLAISGMCTGAFSIGIVARSHASPWANGHQGNRWGTILERTEQATWDVGTVPVQDTREWIQLPIAQFVGLFALLGICVSLNQTIAKFKLRRGHMLRVVAYSAGPAALVVSMISVLAFVMIVTPNPGPGPEFRDWVSWTALGLILIVPMIYLRQGFKTYLGIPHATIAAVLFSVIGFLAMAAFAIVMKAIS